MIYHYIISIVCLLFSHMRQKFLGCHESGGTALFILILDSRMSDVSSTALGKSVPFIHWIRDL